MNSPESTPTRAHDATAQTVPVTIQLPMELVKVIQQRAKQVEQPPIKIIVDAIRQGLQTVPEPSQAASSFTLTSEDWQQLMARLDHLEAILSGQAEAAQPTINQSSASIDPSTSKPEAEVSLPSGAIAAPQETLPSVSGVLESCPKCSQKLGSPLKSSGRQVCSKCGWAHKPRQTRSNLASSPTSVELPPDELQQLLAKAAAEALGNMKPKERQEKSSGSQKPSGLQKIFRPFSN